jgi:hypothetical protein
MPTNKGDDDFSSRGAWGTSVSQAFAFLGLRPSQRSRSSAAAFKREGDEPMATEPPPAPNPVPPVNPPPPVTPPDVPIDDPVPTPIDPMPPEPADPAIQKRDGAFTRR